MILSLGLLAGAVAVGGNIGRNTLILGTILLALTLVGFRSDRHAGKRLTTRPRAVDVWWVGTALPLGIGVWATFLFIGLSARRAAWIVLGVAYASGVVVAVVLNVIGRDQGILSDVSAGLFLGVWVSGAAHARLIRRDVRSELTE